MECRTCDYLLAAFEVAVWQYRTAVQSIRSLEGTARQLAFEKADRLRRVCLDADNALTGVRPPLPSSAVTRPPEHIRQSAEPWKTN